MQDCWYVYGELDGGRCILVKISKLSWFSSFLRKVVAKIRLKQLECHDNLDATSKGMSVRRLK